MGAICSLNVTVCARPRPMVTASRKIILRFGGTGESPLVEDSTSPGALERSLVRLPRRRPCRRPSVGHFVGGPTELVAFGGVPVFLGRAVPAAAGLPVGISEAGDLIVGW